MKGAANNNGRWYPHVTVAAIAKRNGKYLMVREQYRGNLVINQPAGHIEKGESLEQAVIRETLEETGWQFEPKQITRIYQFIAKNGETYIRFTFHGVLTNRIEGHLLDPMIEEVVWLNRAEVEKNQALLRNPVVLECITDYESGNQLPPNGVKAVAL